MKPYSITPSILTLKEKDVIKKGEISSKIIFLEKEEVTKPSLVEESSVQYFIKEMPLSSTQKELYSFSETFKSNNDTLNFYHLVNVTRTGLPYKSLQYAQFLMPFTTQEWSEILHISTRSIDRLKKENKRLSSSQSEKLIEITLLFDYGVDVFGSKSKFSKWLHRNNIALGGLEPKSLFDTSLGMKAVETALLRIEHGILA